MATGRSHSLGTRYARKLCFLQLHQKWVICSGGIGQTVISAPQEWSTEERTSSSIRAVRQCYLPTGTPYTSVTQGSECSYRIVPVFLPHGFKKSKRILNHSSCPLHQYQSSRHGLHEFITVYRTSVPRLVSCRRLCPGSYSSIERGSLIRFVSHTSTSSGGSSTKTSITGYCTDSAGSSRQYLRIFSGKLWSVFSLANFENLRSLQR
jgi:hypothetical protein